MDKLKLPTYGGQAVIEGVMMRGKQSLAIAMRAPDNSIVIHKDNLGNLYRSRIVKIPFLRGMILLWDALGLGMQALTISANTQTEEDEKIEGVTLIVTLGISLAFAVGLFFLLPAFRHSAFTISIQIDSLRSSLRLRTTALLSADGDMPSFSAAFLPLTRNLSTANQQTIDLARLTLRCFPICMINSGAISKYSETFCIIYSRSNPFACTVVLRL